MVFLPAMPLSTNGIKTEGCCADKSCRWGTAALLFMPCVSLPHFCRFSPRKAMLAYSCSSLPGGRQLLGGA